MHQAGSASGGLKTEAVANPRHQKTTVAVGQDAVQIGRIDLD
jgi:hypothetical protein